MQAPQGAAQTMLILFITRLLLTMVQKIAK
jgi:hypothetical protein